MHQKWWVEIFSETRFLSNITNVLIYLLDQTLSLLLTYTYMCVSYVQELKGKQLLAPPTARSCDLFIPMDGWAQTPWSTNHYDDSTPTKNIHHHNASSNTTINIGDPPHFCTVGTSNFVVKRSSSCHILYNKNNNDKGNKCSDSSARDGTSKTRDDLGIPVSDEGKERSIGEGFLTFFLV